MAGLQVVSEEQQEKTRPAKRQPEQSLRCPRCNSTNTKFCYYNNYSLSQPRYFCKGCRRYWTKGGSLRNVPVGGGCRKNKRTSNSKRSVQDQSRATNSADSILLQPPHPPPRHDTGHGLTLDFASLHKRPSAPDHDQESCLLLGINNPIHGNLLEATATISGFQSMYYDYSAAGNGDADRESAVLRPRGGAASGATMTNATTVTTIVHGSRKDEAVDGVLDDVDKVLMGLPWLQVAGKDGAMELNSGRGEQHCYWNEPAVVTGSSTWNSFINTSLM